MKNSYESTRTLCESLDDVNFLGLYRPWNEEWDWLYLFDLTNIERWEEINAHFCEEFRVYSDVPGRFITRVYEDALPWLKGDLMSKPLTKISGRRIYHTQCYLSKNLQAPTIKEFYETQVEICSRLSGIDFIGMFQPWNDYWNWVPIWMMDSLKKQLEMRTEFLKIMGYPEDFTNSFIRFYERHTPS